MEIRFRTLEAECRDDGCYKIGGYVNVTERESELLYSGKRGKWFNEVVKQGAFKRSLNSGKEIPLLLEHDYEKRLADTSNTLVLTEDQIGLRFDAEIRNKEVYEKIKNKEINNCSFGFLPVDQEFEEVTEVREKRFLKDLELLEISLVQNPAYAGSLVEVRNMNEAAKKLSEEEEENKEAEEKEDKVEEVEETTEQKEDEVVSDKESTEQKEDEKRGFVEEQIQKAQKVINNETDTKEVVNEIIEEKEEQLQNAEIAEEWAKEDLEYTKESNKELEEWLEKDVARRSLEVLKLRVQIMKLKSI